MSRAFHLAARAALLAAAAIACTAACRRSPPERLTLAVADVPQSALVLVALANGELARHGLEVTVERHAFGKPALDALLAGRADVATCAETPIVLAALEGRKAAVIAEVSRGVGNIVVLADRAVIAAPPDLAGRRVGVPRGTSAEFLVDALLVRNLVAPAAVRIVDLRPEEMAGALERREVDAVAIWNPISQALRRRFGERLVTLGAEDVYRQPFLLAVQPALVAERPGAVARLLQALLAAETWARARPAEARRLVAAALGLDDEDAPAALGPYEFRVALDQGLVALMEQEARWAIRTGIAAQQPTPNFLDVVVPGPLAALRPAGVHGAR